MERVPTAPSDEAAAPPDWRHLPRTVWILVLARAVNRLGAFTLPFLAVVLVREFGATLTQAGYLLAGFGVATIPSRLFGGRLTDRLGAKATIILGLAGTALAQLMLAAASHLMQAVIATVLLGLAFEIYEPPSQSMIANVTDADHHPAAYGLLAAAMAAAGMGAGLLAALLASLDLRWLFVVDAATCAACATVVAVLLPPARERGGRGKDDHAGPWVDRRLLAMLAAGTVFAVIYLQITIALPLTLTGRHQPTWAIGLLLSLSALTIVACQPLVARRWLRSRDDFTAMSLGYLFLAAGLGLLGIATHLVGFVLATVIWSVGDLILMGRAYTVVAALAPAAHRGRYMAVYGISWGIAAILAPVLGTQLLDRGGPTITWVTIALGCVVLAAAQPAMRRQLTRD